MEEKLAAVLKRFFDDFKINGFYKLSGGLINDSIYVNSDKGALVLQQINQNVFKNITALVENKNKIVSFLNERKFPTANFLKTLTNELYCKIENQIWQISTFIPSKTIDKLNNRIAFDTGKFLAMFHEALLDFPIEQLHYSISDFHNTQKRFTEMKSRLVNANPARLEKAKDEISFLFENYTKILPLVEAINNNEIPLRVVHNDTKVANFLFDADENPICLIDFDTVMPGSILHDIGDALRSGANNSDENEKDLDKVIFNREIYDSFIEGYLSFANSFISENEMKYIHLSLPLILFEQATRFLEDYLINDTYYAIDYSEQNLNRAKTQIKLFKDFQYS